MRFVDSHCHLVMSAFDEDRDAVLARYREAGGDRLLSISTNPDEWSMNRELQLKHDWLLTSLGWHPHDATRFDRRAEEILESTATRRQIQAIGEIGLDYFYDHSPRPDQVRAFERQMRLAQRMDLPVVIHTRQADEDTIRMLRKFKGMRGILHCYTSGEALLDVGIALDYYVSFSGILTFPKSGELQRLIRKVPLDRLLFETDAPYLAPVPFRGKRNEPAHVRHVQAMAARLLGIPEAVLSKQVSDNFNRLFPIS